MVFVELFNENFLLKGEEMVFENIVNRCDSLGVSVYQLEKACELGNGTIGKWKNASPTVNKLKRVADYLGCTVDELLKED